MFISVFYISLCAGIFGVFPDAILAISKGNSVLRFERDRVFVNSLNMNNNDVSIYLNKKFLGEILVIDSGEEKFEFPILFLSKKSKDIRSSLEKLSIHI